MWNTICVGHGPWCFYYLSVTVCYALSLCQSPFVLYLLRVGHGLLCFGPLSVTVCYALDPCRSRSVMLWTSISNSVCYIYYVSVTVCYALDPCRSRSVMLWTPVGHGLLCFEPLSVTVCGGGGAGSKFSTLNFNTLFQIVFHKRSRLELKNGFRRRIELFLGSRSGYHFQNHLSGSIIFYKTPRKFKIVCWTIFRFSQCV